MKDKELKELVEISGDMGFTQATVADYLKISEVYWYRLRKGKAPVSASVLEGIRKLKKKIKAFQAA